MTWTLPAPSPADGPLTGPDRPMLESYLAWQRATFLNVCAGLTAEQLARQAVPASTLSLLGLLRHLAKVERNWLRIRVAGQDLPSLFPMDTDIDFEDGTPADAEQAHATYLEECRLGDEAVAGIGFDHTYLVHGEDFSLRMTYVHLIGEYARHNGHADLLRQSIDGVTGR